MAGGWRRIRGVAGTALKGALLVAAGLLVLGAVTLVLLTQTEQGREQVRRTVERQIDERIEGEVEIGGISGSLISDATLRDVTVEDAAGRSVLDLDSLVLDYSPGTVASLVPEWIPMPGGDRPLGIASIRLVGPRLVLSRRPGEEWNVTELLLGGPGDDGSGKFEPPDVEVGRIELVDARVQVRVPWSPPEELEGEARDSAVARALSERSRIRVETVESGWQRVMSVEELDAVLRDLGPVGPAGSTLGVEVATLDARAYPFAPPALVIDDLTSELRMSSDSIVAGALRLALRGSALEGRVAWAREEGTVDLLMAADPLDMAAMTWLRPDVPRGSFTFDLEAKGPPDGARVSLREVDGSLGGARVAGQAEATFSDPIRVGAADVTVQGLRTDLVKRLFSGPDVPVDGTVDGRMTLEGTPEALDLDGRLVFRQSGGGRSVVAVRGGLALGEEGLAARGLRLRLEPLRVDLVEAVAGPTPLSGTLSGAATLDGALKESLTATDVGLTHRGPDGTSHFVGRVTLSPGDPRTLEVDARLPRLSLATVDGWVPGPPLEGVASGRLRGRGTPGDLTAEARLVLPGGGSMTGEVAWNAAGDCPGYRLEARLDSLDLARAAPSLPATALSGTIEVEGRGVTPSGAEVRVTASLDAPELDSAGTARLEIRARVDGGRVLVDRGVATLASARATVEGAFGLTDAAHGVLDYRIRVDSLADFAHRLPRDTGTVRARPLEQARRLAEARADSAWEAERTRVERAATGRPPPPRLDPDTLPVLSRDSVGGSLTARGTLRGNLDRFDVEGRAEALDLLVAGHALARALLSYERTGAGPDDPVWTVGAGLEEPRLAGLAFDSVSVEGHLEGQPADGEGRATLAVHQDRSRDFRLGAAFTLGLEGVNEVRLEDAVFRFGEHRWVGTDTAVIRWSADGRRAVRRLDLRDDAGGRLYLDGVVRADGAMEGDVEVARLPVADALAVLQDTTRLEGLVDLDFRVEGTRAHPRLEAEAGLKDPVFRGDSVPGLRATVAYRPGEEALVLDAHLVDGVPSGPAARFDAKVPATIRVTDDPAVSLHHERDLAVTAVLDSVAMAPLSALSSTLFGLRGSATGRITVEGSLADPSPEGRLVLDIDSVGAEPLGVGIEDGRGVLRFQDDVVMVDTLVAQTEVGAIRAGGRIAIDPLTSPVFDLEIRAREALVLENERGHLETDADLTLQGSLDSLAVGGRVTIREGELRIAPGQRRRTIQLSPSIPDEALDTTLAATDGPSSTFLENVVLDIEVEIERDTWIRTPNAHVEIFTPDAARPLRVRMAGGPDSIVLTGGLRAARGEYIFAGRRLELDDGALTFVGDPGIDPLVQLSITHEVPRPAREALFIEVNIIGTLRSPRMDLTSNAQPPLSEAELINFLVLGESSSSLLGLTGGVLSGAGGAGGLGSLATQQLAGAAAGSLVDEAAEEIQETGLDVVRIAPGDLPGELAFQGYLGNVLRGTEVEVGKYVTPRLFVAGQGRPTTEVLPGVRMEYRFGEGFVATGTWGPRFLPSLPTLREQIDATRARALAAFLLWRTRF